MLIIKLKERWNMQDTASTNKTQKISFEDYKKQVRDFLIKTWHYTLDGANKLMKSYEDDLPEFFETGWKPNEAGFAMIIGY